MKNLILKFGLIAGAIVAIMQIITVNFHGDSFNSDYAEIGGYSAMIIAFSTIYFAIKSYRDTELGGSISFGKAFKIGLGVTLVASFIYVTCWMILSNTIAKDFMNEYFLMMVEKIEASDIPAQEKAEQISDMENFKEMYKNPLVKIGMTLMEIFPVGLLVSLITAFFLKSKNQAV